MSYKLLIVAGDHKGKVVEITPPTVIGRSKQADITIGHPLVSRRHCEISVHDDGLLVVEDLGSLNGTFHGTLRISEPVYLEPGDQLTVGNVTFEARYGDKALVESAVEETADFDFGTVASSAPAPRARARAAADLTPEVEESPEFEDEESDEEAIAEVIELSPEDAAEVAEFEEVVEVADEEEEAEEEEAFPDFSSADSAETDDSGAAAQKVPAKRKADSKAAAASKDDKRDEKIDMSWLGGGDDKPAVPPEGDDDLNNFFKGLN